MSEKENPKLNYQQLSMFLMKESTHMTRELLEDMQENDGPTAFYMSEPEEIISKHNKIGEYLKYASVAYDLWMSEKEEDR